MIYYLANFLAINNNTILSLFSSNELQIQYIRLIYIVMLI
jgi:hypothetical protein